MALVLAGTIVLSGGPAHAQSWNQNQVTAWTQVYRRTYIVYGVGPVVPAPYDQAEPCHTVVYPDGASYSTCNNTGYYYYGPGYGYYDGPAYNMYYAAPGYYVYGR